MRPRTAMLCALSGLFAGCGAASPEPEDVTRTTAPEATSDKGGDDPGTPHAAPHAPATLEQAVLGKWENASCGPRKYRRRIAFQTAGAFEAVDEIAPCPAQRDCLSSGVINWSGRWALDDRIIALEPVPAEGSKLPEQTPTNFVVLAVDPLSIAEQDGKRVCPYQKVP